MTMLGPSGSPPEPLDVGQELQATPPVRAQEVIQQQSMTQDYVVLRYAVVGLILTILCTTVGILALAFNSRPIPDGITALASAAVGALATMLVRPSIPAGGGNIGQRRTDG